MRKNKSLARIQRVKTVLSRDSFMEGPMTRGIGLTSGLLRDDVNWLESTPERKHRRGSRRLKQNVSDGSFLEPPSRNIALIKMSAQTSSKVSFFATLGSRGGIPCSDIVVCSLSRPFKVLNR